MFLAIVCGFELTILRPQRNLTLLLSVGRQNDVIHDLILTRLSYAFHAPFYLRYGVLRLYDGRMIVCCVLAGGGGASLIFDLHIYRRSPKLAILSPSYPIQLHGQGQSWLVFKIVAIFPKRTWSSGLYYILGSTTSKPLALFCFRRKILSEQCHFPEL